MSDEKEYRRGDIYSLPQTISISAHWGRLFSATDEYPETCPSSRGVVNYRGIVMPCSQEEEEKEEEKRR
jgi:hypothetical protein